MNTVALPTMREFRGEADLDALVNLFLAVAEHDRGGIEVSIDEIRLVWIDEEPGWARDCRVWETGDRLAAAVGVFFQTTDEQRRSYLWIDAHPESREPQFIDEIIDVGMTVASALVGRQGAMRETAWPNQRWKRSGLERAGWTVDRYFQRMSVPLKEPIAVPDLPEGFAIRPLDPEREVQGWVDAKNAGFADHYDTHPTTVDQKRHRMSEPGYIPSLDLVLVNDEGRIIGIGANACETLADGTAQGWVHLFAVVPEYRGRGLGRALLRHCLAGLQQAGFDRALLGADSGNESGALGLYESVGFTVDHQEIQYVRHLDPPEDRT